MLKQKKKQILILDGYTRQCLPLIKGFKEANCEVTVVCHSKLDVAYLTCFADCKILLKCKKEDSNKIFTFLQKEIKIKKYDIVIPLADETAYICSKNKKELGKYTIILVNDQETFEKAIDKSITMRLCMENNIPCPKTYFFSIEEILKDMSKIEFPIVIKPCTACGSMGFNIAKTQVQLKKILNSYAGNFGRLFIQEYIDSEYSQYGAEVYVDRNKNIQFCLITEKPRWYPLDGGSPTINIAVRNKVMENIVKKLVEKMNWYGYANVDFLIDKKARAKVIEVNGRFSAATKINYLAGIDVAKIILNDNFNCEFSIEKEIKYGVTLKCFPAEILWFIKSRKRFKANPGIFNWENSKDVIFSLADPLPFIGFLIQSIVHYNEAMKLRKRK